MERARQEPQQSHGAVAGGEPLEQTPHRPSSRIERRVEYECVQLSGESIHLPALGGSVRGEQRVGPARAGAGLRERQKAAREQRILRAAEVLFARRGYAATAIEDVARRAGLAVGTVYNYFASKSELALALLRRETRETLAAGDIAVASGQADPRRAVTRLLEVYVDLLARHERALLRELFSAALAAPETIGRAAFELDLRLLGQLHGLLVRLRAQGALAPAVDPGQAATTLYAVYLAWVLAFAASETVTVDAVRAQVRAGVALAMQGIARRER
jgi:AcrR family transcriptional regulator